MPTSTLTTTSGAGLDHVVDRLAHDATVSHEQARHLMGELIAFLDEAAGTDVPQRPSPAVDQAWHTFILHTRDYADFCQERFGRFIHHIPEPASSGSARRTPTTRSASNGDADCKSGESSCESEGNCTADCKSGESSCESEGNCTADCKSDTSEASPRRPAGTSRLDAPGPDPVLA